MKEVLTLGELRRRLVEAIDDQEANDAGLPPTERQSRWQSNRPDISHLPAAVGPGGEPLFKVGDRIVVDRRTSMLKGDPWLETISGRVKSVDLSTGVVSVFDEESDERAPRVKYFKLGDPLNDFKLATKKTSAYSPAAVKPVTPSQPTAAGKSKETYKIYGKKGAAAAHTRLKGKAFLAPAGSQFKPGESARVEPSGDKLKVKKADGDHEQLWDPE
jgi:hypothetical protein